VITRSRCLVVLLFLGMVVAACTSHPRPRPVCAKLPDLTGVWTESDNPGQYYIRQIGNRIWWVGLSTENSDWPTHDFHLGLRYANVFEGILGSAPNPDVDPTITGKWVDIPRRTAIGSGTLQLNPDLTGLGDCDSPVGLTMTKISASGSPFGGGHWRFRGVTFRPTLLWCQDLRTCFKATKRNDQGSMANHMSADDGDNHGIIRNDTVIFGRVVYWPSVNFPGFPGAVDRNGQLIGRSYERFMCASEGDDDAHRWFNAHGDPPDGDINFDVDIGGLSTENRDDNASAAQYAKREGGRPYVHVELIMYARNAKADNNCAGTGVPSLLPGWAESGSHSVLLNGRPLDGEAPANVVISDLPTPGAQIATCNAGNPGDSVDGIFNNDKDYPCWVIAMAGKVLRPGTEVRVTGVLAKDDHTDFGTPGVEIHPAYTIEVVDPVRTTDLTGAWEADDDGIYYMREIRHANGRNELWWLGLSNDRGRRFTNVFHGWYTGGGISGDWADVPLSDGIGSGHLWLRDLFVDQPPNTSLVLLPASTGDFGAHHWDQLYRQQRRPCSPQQCAP
jgi:hypothetical protein